jgi:hypothetical protein
MKNLIVLLAILVSIQSCSPKVMKGKDYVKVQQARGNYDMDKWAKQYRKLNSSKAKSKPSVTTEMPKRSTLSPWM